MPSFTCDKELTGNKASEDPFTIKHMPQATTQSPPFLTVHTSSHIDNVSKLPTKTSTNPERDALTRSISPCFSTISDTKTFYSAIEVTDLYLPQGVSSTITELECATPDSDISMEKEWLARAEPQQHDVAGAQPSTHNELVSRQRTSHRRLKTRPSLSQDSSTSKRDRRSTSHSTENRSSSSNTRSSKNKRRRIPTDHSQTSTGSPYRSSYSAMSRQKHYDLISLHRSSCRLFQSPEHVPNSNEHTRVSLKREDSKSKTTRENQGSGGNHRCSYSTINSHMRTNSTPARNCTKPTVNSAAHSSLLNSYGIYLPPRLEPEGELEGEVFQEKADSTYEPSVEDQQSSDAQYDYEKPTSIYKPIPPTVIDWTSPSTRKREYEKIDRSYSGIRGLWRRFAPQFCQPGDRRTPFFEEGKCGNGVYGGSVRRFRMDFSDDHDDEVRVETVEPSVGGGIDGTHQKYDGSVTVKDGRGRLKWKRFKFKR